MIHYLSNIFHALYGNNQSTVKNVIIGENSFRELYDGCCYGRHAEMDVIKKLFRLNKIKTKRDITLIVIRIDKEGNLCNSHPCKKCTEFMTNISNQRKHNIKDIYYSNNEGNIVYTRLSKLEDINNKHISKRFR